MLGGSAAGRRRKSSRTSLERWVLGARRRERRKTGTMSPTRPQPLPASTMRLRRGPDGTRGAPQRTELVDTMTSNGFGAGIDERTQQAHKVVLPAGAGVDVDVDVLHDGEDRHPLLTVGELHDVDRGRQRVRHATRS